jgi:hypothetical protein
MSLLCLNYRGLRQPEVVHELHLLMRREKPLILFLSETRLSSNGIELLRVQLGMKGALGIKGGSTGGGLALLWKVEIDIHIQSYSLHHIDSVI